MLDLTRADVYRATGQWDRLKPNTQRNMERVRLLSTMFVWDEPWIGVIADDDVPGTLCWCAAHKMPGEAVQRLLALGLSIEDRETVEAEERRLRP
ncbi:hypothetical protein [Deinococcus kurensis]|uniref:hypothetical protein n=1 Tax=Deinococcus kurensis TaxID=2662757 RepID=UPI0012D2A051|nr:hypothetical protein [Deinococcus kurensis]